MIEVALAAGHAVSRLIYHIGNGGDMVIVAVVEQVLVELPLLLYRVQAIRLLRRCVKKFTHF